jgi:hypothetical protein
LDHLGTLRTRLADLQGYANLAYELVQNAEDAPNSSWLRFDLRPDALVVDNGGVFSTCGQLNTDPCPWAGSDGTSSSCDFHRFTNIGSGEKGFDSNAVGAMGIGFLVVYQITDSPSLISAGQHWILDEEADERERIKICDGCKDCQALDLPGTRFILPLAVGPTTLRSTLRCRPVSLGDRTALIDKLSAALPDALLFLNNLSRIELLQDGSSLLTLESVREDRRLLISSGPTNTAEWDVFKGNIPADAVLSTMPAGEVERHREVVLAFSQDLNDGAFFAWLPTQERVGLPFHLQADFFPSNDRKRLLWESDYRSDWNRAALRTAATTLAANITDVRDALDPVRLWTLLTEARILSGTQARPVDCFWTALLPSVRTEELILTSDDTWVAPSGAVLVDARARDEVDAIKALGLQPVHEDLRFAWETLIHRDNGAGVPLLRLPAVVSALRGLGLTARTQAKQLPPVLTNGHLRSQLWNLLDGLLGERPPAALADRDALAACAVLIALDGSAVPCREGYITDQETCSLFAPIDPSLAFVNLSTEDFGHLAALARSFSVGDAVSALERHLASPPSTSAGLPSADAIRLLKWFTPRADACEHDPRLAGRLAALPIFPSKDGLSPLTELSLPGQFHDPLGLAALVDDSSIQDCLPLLRVLGVRDLAIVEYVSVHLTRALRKADLPDRQRRDALALLVDRMGEFLGDSSCMKALREVEIVLCQDGRFAPAGEAYLDSEELSLLSSEDARVAQFLKGHEAASRQFYVELGVATKPRLVDLISQIRLIVSKPPSVEAIDRIARYFQALAARVPADGPLPDAIDDLRTEAWLPAEGNDTHWFAPGKLAAGFFRPLFVSQAMFLGLPLSVQRHCSDFIERLGIPGSPTTEQIVKHLLAYSRSDTPVSDGVYPELNKRAKDAALALLTGTRCIYVDDDLGYRRPNHVFWGHHPFGAYRVAFGDELRTLYAFFERVGVREREQASSEDALDVLQEISTDPAWHGNPLTTEVHGVVSRCWALLADAFDRGDVDDASIADLHGKRVIAGTDGLLNQPDRMFLADKGSLAEHFRVTLGPNLIPMTAGTTVVMEAAGVQRLTRAVEMSLIEAVGRGECESLRLRIVERATQICRVTSSSTRGSVASLLNGLAIERVDRLVVQYSLRLFDKALPTPLVDPGAVFLADDNLLLVEMPATTPPWPAVAREIATVLLAKDDDTNVAAGLLQALEPETAVEADVRLDTLGFPRIAAVVVADSGTDSLVTTVGVGSPPDADTPGPPNDQPAGPIKDESTPPAASPAPSSSSSTPTRRTSPPIKRSRFVTYVVQDDETTGSQSPEQVARRRKVELSGVDHVLKHEESARRIVRVMPPGHEGYDLESCDASGAIVRYIEVKSTGGQWGGDGVGLTSPEFSCAQRLGEAYWLYVVEFADTGEARIHRITNPAGRSNQFFFDRGWIGVREEEH